jgi:dipeptidyl aminopeptidase/acylaminoacyl peptidase
MEPAMITPPSQDALAISGRFNFTFSQNGRYGTCLKTNGECHALECWMLASDEPRSLTIPDVVLDGGTHALPLDDGRIMLVQTDRTSIFQRHELTLLEIQDEGLRMERLGVIISLIGGYLLPSPDPTQLGFVIALDFENSSIWRLSASPPHIEFVMQIPGSLDGGVWLDSDASVLAVNQTCSGSRSNGIVIDLVSESWKISWSRSATSSDRILLGSLRSNLIIVATTVSGEERLGWAILGEPTVHFPETLYRSGYERKALALDHRGKRLLVHEMAGATSRLFVYTPAEDSLAPLAGPPGRISSPACWTGDLIRFRFSAPTQPSTLATVRLGTAPRWSLSRDHDVEGHFVAPQAELIEVDSPAGPMEAIVYGGAHWRTCEHLVVALHGGPLSSWHFKFEPLFHSLSAAGIAVVAPNYRGSTGYGVEHLHAVIGNWGGPDLEDVLDLARNLEKERSSRRLPGPIVLGVSYGAFLALLAACHVPELWSACVALAPFLSGPRFYDSANVAVRRRIEQLGGLRPIEDPTGSRDVLHSCATLSMPLLLIHGVADETIPVEQSRMLRRRLTQLGKVEGDDFEYVELDSNHGELIQQNVLHEQVVRFCSERSGLDSNRQVGSPRGRHIEPLPTVLGSGTSSSLTTTRR